MNQRIKLIDSYIAKIIYRIKSCHSTANILYMVSDDRDIVKKVFLTPNFKSLLFQCTNKDEYDTILPENLYQNTTDRGDVCDAISVFGNKKATDVYDENISENIKAKIFLLQDFHTMRQNNVSNDEATQLLKYYLRWTEKHRAKGPYLLIITTPIMDIPVGFEQVIDVIDVPDIGESEIEEHILKLTGLEKTNNTIKSIVAELKGLQLYEIDEIYYDVMDLYHDFSDNDIVKNYRKELISNIKKTAAKRDSTISIIKESDSVVGMGAIKEWADKNIIYFVRAEKAKMLGIPKPKGLLFCGLPGTGKTQMAKKLAYDMSIANGGLTVPLIQFKMENILGGFVGDSEKNFKRCRKRIEALAPCIVLFDEIEKTFNYGENSSKQDYKMNLLTALLDWLQENDKVFFYATCNGTTIPPELLREGRFDMRFSAFLPPQEELAEIMKLHIKRFNGEHFAENNLLSEPDDIEKMIAEFFDRIALFSKGKQRNLFYTGANIESLIIKTNIALAASTNQKPPHSCSTYKDMLFTVATSDDSQPYGLTNMNDVVKYWSMARKNNYKEVSRINLFKPSDFDENTCLFSNWINEGEHYVPAGAETEYDKWLQESVQRKIQDYEKRINNL